MRVVDRHGWAEGMTIESFGRHVGFRTDRPRTLELLLDRFPPGWRPSEERAVRRLYSLRVAPEGRRARRRYHVLYMNARRIEKSSDLDYILGRLEADLQLYIAERAVRRVFVHAGVVAFGDRAVILPGSTMTGKTTLVEALLRAGGTYYSDEYAVFSEAGRVYPFAKPLSVRTRGVYEAPEPRMPQTHGWPVGEKPVRPGLVVLTRYAEGVRFRPRRVSPGRAVLAMLEHTVPARRRPRASLTTLQRVVARVPVWQGRRGDADEAVETVLRILG